MANEQRPLPALNSSFKISRQTKVLASAILDPHRRGEYMRTMIQAQHQAEEMAKRSRKSKKEREEEAEAADAAA